MSFWSDLSPAVKGVLVLGGIGVVVALVFLLGDFGGADEPTTQQRGLPAATQ